MSVEHNMMEFNSFTIKYLMQKLKIQTQYINILFKGLLNIIINIF